jgi:hypothetical protein
VRAPEGALRFFDGEGRSLPGAGEDRVTGMARA